MKFNINLTHHINLIHHLRLSGRSNWDNTENRTSPVVEPEALMELPGEPSCPADPELEALIRLTGILVMNRFCESDEAAGKLIAALGFDAHTTDNATPGPANSPMKPLTMDVPVTDAAAVPVRDAANPKKKRPARRPKSKPKGKPPVKAGTQSRGKKPGVNPN